MTGRRRAIPRMLAVLVAVTPLAAAADEPTTAAAGESQLVSGLLTAGAATALAVGLGLNFAARDRLDKGNRLDALYQVTGDDDLRAARDEADDEARARALASYITIGTGAALAGVAVWLWLADDDAANDDVALRVGPGMVGLRGRF